jgi:CheY-like chemotaxis protein
MHYPASELLRIPLPRTPVNKDKRREIITLSSACASLKADMSAIRIVRVMLVEDHAAFRQSLAALLGREPDLEVVAQAGSLAQARQMLDTPLDVAVLDLSLPDGDGRELIGELRQANAGISILVLTVMLGPGRSSVPHRRRGRRWHRQLGRPDARAHPGQP